MSDYAQIFSSSWALLIVILFFGGSVFVHEFGHYLAAKWRGLKVTRFSIGFGPKLFSWKGADGCVYMVSLFPLGGYVALPQLADMGALEGGGDDDSEDESNLPPISCLDKIIVSAAGAFFNIIFAALLAAVVWFAGLPSNSFYDSNTIGYVSETLTDAQGRQSPSPAKLAGLLAGDKILEIDGKKIRNFSDVIERTALGSGRNDKGEPLVNLKIERGGKILEISAKPILISTNVSTTDAIRMLGVSPAQKMTVGALMPNSPAKLGGLKVGDEVVSINSIRLYSQQQLADILDSLGDDKAVDFRVLRNGAQIDLKILPKKVARTKPLCEIAIGGGGKAEFFNAKAKAENSECVKVLSQKIDNPFFDSVRAGDILYAADGKKISNITQLNALINHFGEKSKIRLSFMSPNMQMKEVFLPAKSVSKIVPPKERVMLGYMLAFAKTVKHPTIPEQFKDAIDRTLGALASLVNPKSDVGISSLAGPVDIGRVIYQLSLEDISLVLSFAVLLNINLAFLNMLPIPVLDGGHIMFALASKIIGRKIPPTIFAAFQGIFSILFISLMVYVVYNGFMRWSGDSRMESSNGVNSEYYINISFKNHE